MSVTIGRETIGGEQVEIQVDSNGKFEAELDGAEYRADTHAALVETLRKAAKRRAKLTPVEITILDYKATSGRWNEDSHEGSITHAVLRGKNPRTRSLLITVGADKTTYDTYSSRDRNIARRLTEAEVEEFRRLKAAIKAAEDEYQAWQTSVRFDVEAFLSKAGPEEA